MIDSPTVPPEPTLLPRLRKAFVFLLVAVLIIVGGWEGFRYAKLHLALARARRDFSTRQYMRAEFWAGRAFTVDEKNVEATRLMAEINEVLDRPVALSWRIKLVQREPGNPLTIMAWAKCAMRFSQPEMAINALQSLPRDFKERSAEYHELVAGYAAAGHQTSLAEAYFLKAAELDPKNPVHRVNLAAFRLANSSSPEVRDAALRDLEGQLGDSRVSLFAIRALLVDAIRRREPMRAQRFAEKLRSLPEHRFSDDLICLEATVSESDFRLALDEVEHRAASDAFLVTLTGDWLNARGMAAETRRWFAQLPEAIQSNVQVQMTLAESLAALSDWAGLEAFLATCQWTDGEFLKRAMLIRCHRELSQPWEKEWKALVTEVKANPPNGLLLGNLILGWSWRDEALDLLWDAATRPKMASKALQDLWSLYSRTNETRALLRVARAQIDLDPTDPAAQNNVAFLSLLLDGASDRSERLARQASTAHPGIPEWAATYAFALHLSGHETEAKRVMEKLSPEALARPGLALYSAIIQAANGDDAQARESLAKLNPKGLLPEEQKLAADLAQQLNPARH